MNLSCIKKNIRTFCHEHAELTGALLDDLLRFPLNLDGFNSAELEQISIQPKTRFFRHIPTGLMSAGFLANVALLQIDAQISRRSKRAQVAHFRYVDDHVVLARDFNTLESWISQYQSLLVDHGIGTDFNSDKFQPDDLLDTSRQALLMKRTTNCVKKLRQRVSSIHVSPFLS